MYLTQITQHMRITKKQSTLNNTHLGRYYYTCDFEKAFVILQIHCLKADLSRLSRGRDIPKSLTSLKSHLCTHSWKDS